MSEDETVAITSSENRFYTERFISFETRCVIIIINLLFYLQTIGTYLQVLIYQSLINNRIRPKKLIHNKYDFQPHPESPITPRLARRGSKRLTSLRWGRGLDTLSWRIFNKGSISPSTKIYHANVLQTRRHSKQVENHHGTVGDQLAEI